MTKADMITYQLPQYVIIRNLKPQNRKYFKSIWSLMKIPRVCSGLWPGVALWPQLCPGAKHVESIWTTINLIVMGNNKNADDET